MQPPVNYPCPLDRIDFKILHAATKGVGVQTLCKYLLKAFLEDTPQITQSAALKRTQRHLAKLRAAGLVVVVNPSEKPFLWRSTRRALDLFSSARNSNSVQKSPFDIPVRCAEERKASIKLIQSIPQVSKDIQEKCVDNFEDYLLDIGDKEILMVREILASNNEVQYTELLHIPYQTRWNNPEHHRKNLFIYHQIWDNATLKYKRAVHLVLTTDPKRFKNLWEANRHFSKAFNRFLSYLQKHFHGRPRYLAAYEYTRSGLMHAHIILFGRPYLLPHEIITKQWERCNQGSYNYIYSLINNNGNWNYARKKPKEVKEGETPRDYLKKYLVKSQEHPELNYLYWVFNKRFFTYSRSLYTDPWPRAPSLGIYHFLMTCYTWEEPDVIVEMDNFHKAKPPPWEASFPVFDQSLRSTLTC